MKTTVMILFALATVAVPATAQQQDTFLIHGPYGINTSSTLYEIDHNATLIRTVTSLPSGVRPMDIVMSEDNQTYRVLGFDLARSVVMVFDVTRSGAARILTTFQASMPQGMLRTDDGDWLVSTQVMAQRPLSRIYRIQGNTVSTLTSAWNLLGYATTWDLDTGDLVMRGRGPDTFGTTLWGYYRVDLTSGQFTTIVRYPEKGLWPATIGAHHPIYEAVPGTFVDAVYDSRGYSMRMVHVHPELGIRPLSGDLGGHAPSDLVRAGQRNFPAKYVMLLHTHPISLSYYLFWMSGDGWPLAVKPVNLPFSLISDTRMMRVQDRHLAWFMDQAPNGRSLRLDFPAEGGRPYVVAFGMSGPRPGVRLADGRPVPINPDPLTWASLSGGLGSILKGTVGVLDPLGRARVTVDLNSLGSRLKGLRVWAVALLVDRSSLSGVSHIVGPTVLNIKS